MTIDLSAFVAAGYYLSRHTGVTDFTGTVLRRMSLAHDHTSRRFFPAAWTLSWCDTAEEHRLEQAAEFGITPAELDRVMEWADRNFDVTFGAWHTFFTLEEAQAAAREFLPNAPGLELLGAGLHRDLVKEYCAATAPPPPEPGYAQMGAMGPYRAACEHARPLAPGGTTLGFELIVDELTGVNSVESLHGDEATLFQEVGATPNELGLLASHDVAWNCCRNLRTRDRARGGRRAWFPWLLVQYPVLLP